MCFHLCRSRCLIARVRCYFDPSCRHAYVGELCSKENERSRQERPLVLDEGADIGCCVSHLVSSRALRLCCLLSSCAAAAMSGRQSAVMASPSAGNVRNIIESTDTGHLKHFRLPPLLLRLHSSLIQSTLIHTSPLSSALPLLC
jgi:hypothetical protein